MNRCSNYNIPCLYALSGTSDLLCCVPNQEACDAWRAKYKREVTDTLSLDKIRELEKKLLADS